MPMLPIEQVQSKMLQQSQSRRRRTLLVSSSLGLLITLILNNLHVFHDPWSTILSAILSALTVILSLPFSPDALKYFLSTPSSSEQLPAISPLLPLSQTRKVIYNRIERDPPFIESKVILKRQDVVEDIYKQLQQPEMNAITLTGIIGSGKTIIAAMLYQYAENQRSIRSDLFKAKTLWFGFDVVPDPMTAMSIFTKQLWAEIGKRASNFSSLDPYEQWKKLFKELQHTKKHRLIIIDHLDTFLDWRTGRFLPDYSDIGELISEINNRKCNCRFLFTCRALPQAMSVSLPMFMKIYHLGGLQPPECVKLLRQIGVEATDTNGGGIVKCSAGHAFTLVTLAAEMLNENLDLASFTDPKFARTCMEDIAHAIFDRDYTQTVMQDQEMLTVLLALSIYREPVTIDTLQLFIASKIAEAKVRNFLKVLRTQELLLHDISKGYYQLHPIFSNYVQNYCKRNDDLIQKLSVTHSKVAQEYLKQAAIDCPPRVKRRQREEINTLIEAIWHQCHADQWQEAYDIILQEGIFTDLHRWGNNMALLELYQLLLPLEKWQPDSSQTTPIYIQLRQIYEGLGQQEQVQKYDKLANANVKKGTM